MPARLKAAPVATGLTAAQIKRLHRLLVDEHDLQRARLVELQDPLDLEPDLAEVLLARCQETLEEIEAAFALIDRGEYGSCSTCGSPIPYERLEAVPATRRCVACQSGRDRIPR